MSNVKSPKPPKTSTEADKLNEIKSLPTHYAAAKTEWTGGPDKLCPAESYFATRLDEAVSLRYTEPDLKKFPPLSVYSIFKQTVSQRPDHPALAFKKSGDDDRFTMLSYLEYWRVAHKAAKSFIKVPFSISLDFENMIVQLSNVVYYHPISSVWNLVSVCAFSDLIHLIGSFP